mmetsp:Transcript_8005/g.14714  ORF Transcript_8005/g.14714 Transcript_8005/m.14714 type:complete len:89 (-) Transcript_8005:1280-1546(-)
MGNCAVRPRLRVHDSVDVRYLPEQAFLHRSTGGLGHDALVVCLRADPVRLAYATIPDDPDMPPDSARAGRGLMGSWCSSPSSSLTQWG